MPAKHDTNGVEVPGTRWNGDEHDGTKWVPAGQGATVWALLHKYIANHNHSTKPWPCEEHLINLLMERGPDERTNVTVERPGILNAADLKRIEQAEVK